MNELGYLDKLQLDIIYKDALSQCKRVEKAKEKVYSAYSAFQQYVLQIDSGWQGDSAAAASEKYWELRTELWNIYRALDDLQNAMECDAELVKLEWPASIAKKL